MKLPRHKQHVFFFLKDGEPDHEGQTAFFGWFDAENAQFIIEGETAYKASSVRLWVSESDFTNMLDIHDNIVSDIVHGFRKF